jgi:hypothetical protein
MPNFLVERYLSASQRGELEATAARLAAASRDVRHVRATFIPGDEVCLHIFEAESLEAVREALRRAAVAYERVVEAIDPQGEPQ